MKLIKILVEDQDQVDMFLEVLTDAEENGKLGDYFTVHTSDYDPKQQKLWD